jgi:two-component system alkaline phosphatase synthesis response regulator PhoP
MTLTDRLMSEGYSVECAQDGETAFEHAQARHYDLIILDVMLPGRNGFDVCRDLRQSGYQLPILMLTARRQVVDKVVGLKLGADDYLTKPFDMSELLARVEALLRRAHTPLTESAGSYAFGNIQVNFLRSEVTRDGEPINLSALDFKLLKYFIENRGQNLTRDKLLDEVWGYEATPYTRTVDVHIAGLRQKIEENPVHPKYLITVHRVGYKFAG